MIKTGSSFKLMSVSLLVLQLVFNQERHEVTSVLSVKGGFDCPSELGRLGVLCRGRGFCSDRSDALQVLVTTFYLFILPVLVPLS